MSCLEKLKQKSDTILGVTILSIFFIIGIILIIFGLKNNDPPLGSVGFMIIMMDLIILAMGVCCYCEKQNEYYRLIV